MQGEAGTKVAPPIFLHPGARFHDAQPHSKKRDSPWQNPSLRHGHQQNQNQPWLIGSVPPSPKGNWNPKMWNWDSVGFSAKPVEEAKGDESSKGSAISKHVVEGGEDGSETLTLKLGGGAYSAAEQPAVRPNKKVRSGSPGTTGSSYPMCQVDDCRADLSGAKDYHRRHKVCELHSKTTKALVGKQMQRFCQQCSRFHPLSEFDEGKRSCRRRLAGHNRRRRKTQLEDASSGLLSPGNKGNSSSNGNLDIVNLLAVLARLQGNGADKLTSAPPLPDRDHIIQILSKINSLPNANSFVKLAAPAGLDLNVSQPSQHGSSGQSAKVNGTPSAPSTMDLLTVLSAALAATSPDAIASICQGSSDSSEDRTKMTYREAAADISSHTKSAQIIPSIGAVSNGCVLRSQLEIPKHPIQEAQSSLPFQLFSSAEDDSPPQLGSSRKYVSSESSNPMDDRSPSSSPPMTRKLFPLHSSTESMKRERMSISTGEHATVEASASRRWGAPLDFFKESQRRVVNSGALRNLPYQAGYTSSSGSDQSPSSSNSDAQDRTGRILFKLFDKDPDSLPWTLRTQILSWLSHSPSEIESYIRPGCVVLSVYVSMPSVAWDELEKDLLQRVSSLVECCESDFWRSGRFLVQTNRQLALHKDGKLRLCKSWRTWNAPELTSVSPIAVASGKETSLILRGRNLTAPGTKIHCTYMGSYTSKEVLSSAYPGSLYDDSGLESFSFPRGYPHVFGRCFIEVENGFKGNSFPVIVADAEICQELKDLERDFEEDRRTTDVQVRPSSRADVLHFLNELGWLFQRKNASYPFFVDFSCTRFKFLFTFSVQRDWSALVKTLLDMLVERSSKGDGLLQESLGMLLEIQLLSKAVKRKCRKMVDLLLHYYVKGDVGDLKMYLFPPNLSAPGGVTPLHLAASMLDSEDIVDALTNDPQEIGLKCWSSMKDDIGQSPYMYASTSNNHSYNMLVARKLVDRGNDQLSILVGDQETSLDTPQIARAPEDPGTLSIQVGSCARCAIMETGRRFRPTVRGRGLLQRPYIHSILVVAAVCVCVCLLFRGSPKAGSVSLKWENLDYGSR